jgi:hypothetical protein
MEISSVYIFARIPNLLIYIFVAFAITGCAVLPSTNEVLQWQPVEGFNLADSRKTGWSGISHDAYEYLYIKGDVNDKYWKERAVAIEYVVAQTTFQRFHWNPENIMNYVRKKYEEIPCPTSSWTVLEQDESSILYEWDNIKCSTIADQYKISRIIVGFWYAYEIQYGLRNKEISEDERSLFIENLMGAMLEVKK